MINGESWRELPPEELIAYLDQCSPEERDRTMSRILVHHIAEDAKNISELKGMLEAWTVVSNTSIGIRFLTRVLIGLAAIGSLIYGAVLFVANGGHPPH